MTLSKTALLLMVFSGCGDSKESPEAEPPAPPTIPTLGSPDGADTMPLDQQVLWSAEVKSTLEPLIESQLGLRNRIETSRPQEPIRIVLLELPPRSVPKELPSGEIRNVLNPNGAPTRIRILVRDVIEASRLEIAGFELFNGKLNPDSPTPFQ